jgi:hypothetical protein
MAWLNSHQETWQVQAAVIARAECVKVIKKEEHEIAVKAPGELPTKA